MVSKIKFFLKAKSNWIYVITVLFAVSALIISFFLQQYSYQVIGVMFAIIVVDNFLILVFYMDDIKNKSDDTRKDIESIKMKLDNTQVDSINYNSSSCDYKKEILQAKKCIFFNCLSRKSKLLNHLIIRDR